MKNEPMTPKVFDKEILGLIFSIAEIHDHPEVEMNPVLEQALNAYTALHARCVELEKELGGCTTCYNVHNDWKCICECHTETDKGGERE